MVAVFLVEIIDRQHSRNIEKDIEDKEVEYILLSKLQKTNEFGSTGGEAQVQAENTALDSLNKEFSIITSDS